MADCINIQLEQIRAYIRVGNHYYVTTGTDDNSAGNIMSFTINKSRGGNMIATFRCQLEVNYDAPIQSDLEATNNNVGQPIVVHAGVGESSDPNSLPRLFTGYLTSVTQEPHWDDASKFVVNISGEDEFALMKYGPKFSRRFKSGDDAYAVITGGDRRDGGQMTRLRHVPAGKRGVEVHATGSNQPLEHSPLIRTPDPQGKSPNAVSRSESRVDESESRIKFSQDSAYLNSGDKIFVSIDNEDGTQEDPESLKNVEGVKCLLCANPKPSSFSSNASSNRGAGLEEGAKTYPVSAKYTRKGDKPGIEFTMTGDYPAQVTFIHPLTGETCTINFYQIPPHDHTDITRGGPAMGSYSPFQV